MIKGLLSVSVMSVIAAILLTGCGGGSDTTTTTTSTAPKIQFTGFLYDSAVSGVSYVCGDQSGITGVDGSFNFQKDQGCTFSLAGITLRTVAAANLVDQVKILENNVSVAQMLQTLDNDGNASNGITITPAVIAAVKTANITTPPADDAAAITLFNAVKAVSGYTGSAKTTVETNTHLVEAQTPILKALIAGKTFYIADSYYSDSAKGTIKELFEVTFNADATTIVSKLVATTDSTSTVGDTTTETISLNGTKIMFNNPSEPGHLYEEFLGQTADAITLRSNDNPSYLAPLYFDKAKAEVRYATLSSTTIPTPTTPSATSAFDASALLLGKTFYNVAPATDGKVIRKTVFNAAGTTIENRSLADALLESGSISFSGDTVHIGANGNLFIKIIASTGDYIEIQADDGHTERFYFDLAKAQAYTTTY